MRAFQQLREDLREEASGQRGDIYLGLWYATLTIAILLGAVFCIHLRHCEQELIRLRGTINGYDSVTRQLGYSCQVFSDRVICEGAATQQDLFDAQSPLSKTDHML